MVSDTWTHGKGLYKNLMCFCERIKHALRNIHVKVALLHIKSYLVKVCTERVAWLIFLDPVTAEHEVSDDGNNFYIYLQLTHSNWDQQRYSCGEVTIASPCQAELHEVRLKEELSLVMNRIEVKRKEMESKAAAVAASSQVGAGTGPHCLYCLLFLCKGICTPLAECKHIQYSLSSLLMDTATNCLLIWSIQNTIFSVGSS